MIEPVLCLFSVVLVAYGISQLIVEDLRARQLIEDDDQPTRPPRRQRGVHRRPRRLRTRIETKR